MDALFDRHFNRIRALVERRLPRPEPAVGDLLVRLQVIAVRDDVLARERPPPADVVERLEIRLGPRTPVTRARSTGIKRGGPDWGALCESRNVRT